MILSLKCILTDWIWWKQVNQVNVVAVIYGIEGHHNAYCYGFALTGTAPPHCRRWNAKKISNKLRLKIHRFY